MYAFLLQAWFSGKKVGEGIGKSRREALQKAAELSLQNLAGKTFFRVLNFVCWETCWDVVGTCDLWVDVSRLIHFTFVLQIYICLLQMATQGQATGMLLLAPWLMAIWLWEMQIRLIICHLREMKQRWQFLLDQCFLCISDKDLQDRSLGCQTSV